MDDLSRITDVLTQIIGNALKTSPLWAGATKPEATANHPAVTTAADTAVNLYLFHVAQDKVQVNTFWSRSAQGGATQPVAFEPLGLDLWYMLTAQSTLGPKQEQQALGVAMRALHEHGTFAIPGTTTPPPGSVTPSVASLVLESPGLDELSRLWQALNLALRPTAQYRVSVVFLDSQPPVAPQPPPTTVTLTSTPRSPSSRRTVRFTTPGPAQAAFPQSPAATAPAPAGVVGQEVTIDGRGLQAGDSLLLASAGGDTDITAWKVAHAAGLPLRLRAPAGSPVPPGHYQLVVARPGFRSETVPLAVAAWVDPAPGPLLAAGANGRYTVAVRNVPPKGAELRLGATMLERIADGGAPGPGEWQHQGDVITFRAPAGTAAGTHQIALRVADVESDPALWAVVP